MYSAMSLAEAASKPIPVRTLSRAILAGVVIWIAGAAGAATVSVTIRDNSFNPKSVTINAGDTVVWTNQGSVTHTSTSGSSCSADGKWNSGNMGPGATFSFMFAGAGSYPYFCRPHCASGMTGSITVSGAAPLTCSGGASPSSGTAPLAVLFTGSAAGGAAPYAYAWNFGDGTGGSGASMSHTYAAGGAFEWTLTVTDAAAAACSKSGVITAAAAPVPSLFLSSAARSAGAKGTNWKTDAVLFNPGPSTVHYTLYYTPAAQDGTTTPFVRGGSVEPDAAPLLTNFIETLFGLTDSAGSVRFVTDGPLRLSSRTYNDTGSGTYGQWVPGQTADDAIAPSADPAQLIGIVQDADYRTNIGFSEIGGQSATVLVSVFDGQGHPLAQDFPVPVKPYSWVQLPITNLGGISGDNLRVRIVNQGPGTVLGYSSVADNRTGDAICVPAQKDGDVLGQAHQVVAVAAKASGAFNTDWATDLYLYNPTTQTQNAALQFVTAAGVFSASFLLQGHEVRFEHDVVAARFSAAGSNASGSLQVRSDQGLILVSRTFNQTVAGTYGQLVPASNPGDPIGVGETADLLEVTSTADYRTNVGFSEYSGTEAAVSAILYDSLGNTMASTPAPVAVPAGGNAQFALNDLFNHSSLLDSGRIRVMVVGGGSVIPYISVVDNRTGDAICVPGKK